MQTLISVKSKRNPWVIPMWLVEHPFWAFQLGLLTLSLIFLALALLSEWMLFLAFLTWAFMGICLLGGVIDFFYDGGWIDIKRWIYARYDNYGKVED